jgi:glycerol-3-phosphate acyltransferase PlsX
VAPKPQASNMRIAVDAMGGDHAPRVVVDGAVAAARRGISVSLVGDAGRIRAELARYGDRSDFDITVVPADQTIDDSESPAAALRRKPGASIKVTAELIASGQAAAMFSAGHTGATVVAAYAALGLIRGVDRPALAATIPTRSGTAVLLDVGANADCRAQHLVQFAMMGTVYARVVLGIAEPRVGLLSIGEEASKGNELTREAHQLLRAAPVRFIGNVEARDVYGGGADVAVCDGFTGNVALKFSEGMVGMVETLVRDEFSLALRTGMRSLLGRQALRRFRQRLDYAEYGGAPLLGVAGHCIVGHGRSSARAVRAAILLAHRFAVDGLVPRIEEELMSTRGSLS